MIARYISYLRRVFPAYLGTGVSQLSFWHDRPKAMPEFEAMRLGPYYQDFRQKAAYRLLDRETKVPVLDYRGRTGLQFNPIAIAQWGLGNHQLWLAAQGAEQAGRVRAAADWLAGNLDLNSSGVPVWWHHFDFEYREGLSAPWYSGLAQGQGISLLIRAHEMNPQSGYLEAAEAAFESLKTSVDEGGAAFWDCTGDYWIEEYLVDPPSHILNGFLWASWGLRDYYLAMRDTSAERLFQAAAQTIARNLPRYDTGYWSMYEAPWGERMLMLASPFYHRLHTVQLGIMARLTGMKIFEEYSRKWLGYQRKPLNRAYSLAHKSIFKLRYY